MITGFIVGLTLAVSAITGAFNQGQENPEASNFFDSTTTVIEGKAFIVDTI
tara:strand:- start:281 stop:433 length:153 start_codon:yes stop_codon:yes gene_type:complete